MKTKKVLLIIIVILMVLVLLTTKSKCTITHSNEIVEGGPDDYVCYEVEKGVEKQNEFDYMKVLFTKWITAWQTIVVFIGVELFLLIFSIKKKRIKQWIILNIIIFVLIVMFYVIILLKGSTNTNSISEPRLYIQREDWAPGMTTTLEEHYEIGIAKGKTFYINDFDTIRVLDIDEEGVLVEYIEEYYEKENDDNNDTIYNYICLKKRVEQKLLWNKLYKYKDEEGPDPACVEGGVNYYFSFEK